MAAKWHIQDGIVHIAVVATEGYVLMLVAGGLHQKWSYWLSLGVSYLADAAIYKCRKES